MRRLRDGAVFWAVSRSNEHLAVMNWRIAANTASNPLHELRAPPSSLLLVRVSARKGATTREEYRSQRAMHLFLHGNVASQNRRQ